MLRPTFSDTHSTSGSLAPSDNIAPRDYQPSRFTKAEKTSPFPPSQLNAPHLIQTSNLSGGWSLSPPYSHPTATRISRISPSAALESGAHSSSLDEDQPKMGCDDIGPEGSLLLLSKPLSSPYSSNQCRRSFSTKSIPQTTSSLIASNNNQHSFYSDKGRDTAFNFSKSKASSHSQIGHSPVSLEPSTGCTSPYKKQLWMRFTLLIFLLLLFVASPILMLLMPHLNFFRWPSSALHCSPHCESTMLTLCMKVFIFLPAFLIFIVFWRDRTRIYSRHIVSSTYLNLLGHHRLYVLGMFVFLIFIFWIMYVIRVLIVAPVAGGVEAFAGGGIPSLHSSESVSFETVVSFVQNFVDVQLWCCIVCLSMLFYHTQHSSMPAFIIEVVRSPDGVTQHYTLPSMTIREAVVEILEKYLVDFQVFNPLLEGVIHRRANDKSNSVRTSEQNLSEANSLVSGMSMSHSFTSNETSGPQSGDMITSSSTNGHHSHSRRGSSSSSRISSNVARLSASEWFHEEEDYIRRVSKQRARLMVAAEEAFSLVRRLPSVSKTSKVSRSTSKLMSGRGGAEGDLMQSSGTFDGNMKEWAEEEAMRQCSMDPYTVAQSIFPTLLKPLQKYLRLTRQQSQYSMENILEHLAICLYSRSSSRTFVERYLLQCRAYRAAHGNSVSNNGSASPNTGQEWRILCGKNVSRKLSKGLIFQLLHAKSGVQLLCSVHALPQLRVKEESMTMFRKQFLLTPKVDTSV